MVGSQFARFATCMPALRCVLYMCVLHMCVHMPRCVPKSSGRLVVSRYAHSDIYENREPTKPRVNARQAASSPLHTCEPPPTSSLHPFFPLHPISSEAALVVVTADPALARSSPSSSAPMAPYPCLNPAQRWRSPDCLIILHSLVFIRHTSTTLLRHRLRTTSRTRLPHLHIDANQRLLGPNTRPHSPSLNADVATGPHCALWRYGHALVEPGELRVLSAGADILF